MIKEFRIRRLERKICIITAKINVLRKAEHQYSCSYYTDKLISETEKLSGLEFDLLRIKGDL